MIAGEYAQAARVKWERVVHAKLSTKISDRVFSRYRNALHGPAGPRSHVRLKELIDALHAFEINRIGSGFRQPVRRGFGEELARILLALFPDLRIEIAKDAGAVGRPAPPVVPG